MGEINELDDAIANVREKADWGSFMSEGESEQTEAAAPRVCLQTLEVPAAVPEIIKTPTRVRAEAKSEAAEKEFEVSEKTEAAEMESIQAAATAAAEAAVERAAAAARRAAGGADMANGGNGDSINGVEHQSFLDLAHPKISPRPLFKKEVETESIEVDPHKVLFTNPCINDRFTCGRSVESTIEALTSGELTPDDIPLITVVQQSHRVVTLDHRRLYAFRAAFPPGTKVPARLLKSGLAVDKFSRPDVKVYHAVRVETESTCGRGLIPASIPSDCKAGKRHSGFLRSASKGAVARLLQANSSRGPPIMRTSSDV